MSQRKLKAQKINDAKQVLITGIAKLASANQLMSTLDVANKLLDIISEDAKWDEEDYKCLCDAAYKLWVMDHGTAENFVASVAKHAEDSTKFLTEFHPSTHQRCHSSRWEDFVEFAILSGEPSLFSSENLVKKAASGTSIPSLMIRLLSVKNFAAASALFPASLQARK